MSLEAEIYSLEFLGDHRGLHDMELAMLAAVNANLQKWQMRQSRLYSQYSRVKNINDKDNNAKLFFSLASTRMKSKILSNIKVGSVVVKGRDQIEKSFKITYHNSLNKKRILMSLSLLTLSKDYHPPKQQI